jgi:UDP-N-acetylglucosamine/UDP-N-acetyl-alpha-D-glucosaminouronate 4-epimerase
MRVLITGGGGFIGSHLVDRFLADGHDVRVLDNFATGRRENLVHVMGDVELVEGDMQSYERVHNAMAGVDGVLHEAALPSVPRSVADPLTTNASNVIGTLNVLLAARDAGAKRVVFASSSSVYGANPTLPQSEDLALSPISPYAVTKLTGEGYCRSFHHVYGLETVALRYFNIFGPRQDPLSQYAAVVPNFITSVLCGRGATVFGNGEQSRDFTFVENVMEANRLALEAPDVAGKAYNVACGERITLNQMLDEIAEITGTEAEAQYLPPRPGDVLHSHASIERAEDELGYRPLVPFREGLRRSIEHFAARQASAASV